MTKTDEPRIYSWPHPKYTKSKTQSWLKGRYKHPTPFCSEFTPLSAQGHEGENPRASDGTPRKVCVEWQKCPCTCHQRMDEMYAMAEMEREPAEQSEEYNRRVAEQSAEVRQMLDALYAIRGPFGTSSIDPGVIPHNGTESPVDGPSRDATGGASGTIPAPVAPVFNSTPTGRRAKGQLEFDVLKVCGEYSRDVFDWSECTPRLVADQIGKMNETEPPSTGAVNAVWDRWEVLGFAHQAKKPSRFLSFEMDDSIQTLDMLKARAKRDKRMGKAQEKRGELRARKR